MLNALMRRYLFAVIMVVLVAVIGSGDRVTADTTFEFNRPVSSPAMILLGSSLTIDNLTIPDDSEPSPEQTDSQALFTPTLLTGDLCSAECISQQIEIVLPPLEDQVAKLDMVIVMDVTGSMSDEFEVVKATIGDIVTELRTDTPDMRFAFIVFGDFPQPAGWETDSPYELVSPFTTDLTSFRSAVDGVAMQHGGDSPETATLALWEAAQLDWRPDTVRVVLLFTDSYVRDPDSGRDGQMGTDDDLTTAGVIELLQDETIIVMGIQSGDNGSSRAFLQEVSIETDGIYYGSDNAEQIPEVVIELIGVAVSRELRLRPVDVNFDTEDGADDWLSIQPSTFDYPLDSSPVYVDVQICPGLGNLSDRDYVFQFELRDNQQSYGTVDVDFTYDRLCSNMFIPDNSGDDGQQCSDVGGQVFWDSPAIVVRRTPEFSEITEFPVAGQPSYVYVQVQNQGPRPAEAVDVVLYSSEAQFNDTFSDGDWREVGRKPTSLDVGETQWVGPITWIPTADHIMLRAAISSSVDPIETPDDVACDNNIVQLSRIPVTLDIPSYGPGVMAGSIPITLTESLTYNTLDLEIQISDLSGENSFVAIDLDRATYDNWSQSLSGGNILSSGRVMSISGVDELVLGDLVGGPTVQTDLSLLLVSSAQDQGILHIGLSAEDRTVTGTTIYFTVDRGILPNTKADAPQAALTRGNGFEWPVLYPIVATLSLFGLYFIVKLFKR